MQQASQAGLVEVTTTQGAGAAKDQPACGLA